MADERDTFKFKVETDTKKAFSAADDLKKLVRDVEKSQVRASKNAGVISENALLEQKKRYQELSKEVAKYEATLKKAQSISGLDRQARELSRALDTIKSTSKRNSDGEIVSSKGPQQKAATAINKSARAEFKTNNSSFGQYKQWNQASPSFREDRSLIRDYQKMTSDLKATVRQQGTITNRTQARNHITATDQNQFKANRKYIEKHSWDQLKDATRTRDAIQGKRDETKAELHFQQSTNSGATRDEINATKAKLEYLNKENKSVLEFIETMDSAVKTMGVYNRDMKQATNQPRFSTDPAKGSMLDKLKSRSFAIAANTINKTTSAVKERYQQGRNIYSTYGTEAMNLGSQLNSNANDKAMLSRIQKTGTQYGLTTQDSLAYYSMAESRSGNSGTKGFETQTNSLGDAYAKNQRRSGLNDDNYKDLMGAIQGANGVSKSSDVSSIVNQVLAANQMSGNSGNYQQFAQTMTTMIAKISASGAMSKNETKTVAATQSSLSSLGKSWQGESGKNAASNLNAGFVDASNQQNAGLVFLKMQQLGQGGATGRQNALLSLQKGLGDKSNIDLLRQNVSHLGTAQGMQFAEQNFSQSPEQAKELVEGIQNGSLSDAEIQKRFAEKNNKADKAGKRKAKSNKDKYDRSLTSKTKKVDSKKERNSTVATGLVGGAVEGTKGFLESNVGLAIGSTVVGGLAGGILQGTASSFGSKIIGGIGKHFIPKSMRPNAQSVYEDLPKSGSKGGTFSKIKEVAGKFKEGGGQKNVFSRFKSMFGGADDAAAAASKSTETASAVSKATKAAGEATKGGKAVGLLGKVNKGLGKGLGKVAIPLALLSSGATILSAKDKVKATAGEAGSWGGALAGAQLGASAGTFVGGPIGTAVGGVIGAVGGGILGEKAVKSAYDPIANGVKGVGKSIHNWWDDATGKDDKSSSKSKSKSKTSQQATGGYLSYREQNSLLTKEKDIVNERAKFVKDYNKVLTKESNKGNSSSKKKATSKHANGGVIQNETTYVAEGNKAEVVVPTDPAKRGRAKSLVNQIAGMTGVRATDARSGGSKTINQGAFSPSININVSGNADQGTVDAMAAKVKDALNSATDNYRTNKSYSW